MSSSQILPPPTDEDFLVALESALEKNLLPAPGFAVLERTRDDVVAALAPLVAQLRTVAPAVPAGQAPATGQTALRDRIAEALLDHLSRTADIRHDTDGELAFMPVVTDEERMRIAAALAAVLPASVDRAAVLREAADELDAHAAQLADVSDDPAVFVAKARSRAATEWRVAAALVRRMAAAAPSAVVVRRATDETPGEADVPPAAIRAAALREAVAELKRDAFGPIARLLRMADEAEHPETACICTEDAWPPHCPCRNDEQPAVRAQQPKEA